MTAAIITPDFFRGPVRFSPAPKDQIRDPDGRFEGLPLKVEFVDGVRWRLERDVSYRIARGLFEGVISTPRAGFVFDFASIPWLFRRMWPRSGNGRDPYGIASVWHDWLYTHRAINGHPIARRQADQLFLEIMLYVGVRPFVARSFYTAVRLGGWLTWSKRSAEIKKGMVYE